MKFVWSILLLAAFTVSAEVIEAESGKLDPAGAKIEENKDASKGLLVRMVGKYVMKPEEVKTDAPGLTVPFKTAAAGKYEIKLTVFAATSSSDSVYLQIDQGKLESKPTGFPKKGEAVSVGKYQLTAGDHVLRFFTREPNFGIDKIEIEAVR